MLIYSKLLIKQLYDDTTNALAFAFAALLFLEKPTAGLLFLKAKRSPSFCQIFTPTPREPHVLKPNR